MATAFLSKISDCSSREKQRAGRTNDAENDGVADATVGRGGGGGSGGSMSRCFRGRLSTVGAREALFAYACALGVRRSLQAHAVSNALNVRTEAVVWRFVFADQFFDARAVIFSN